MNRKPFFDQIRDLLAKDRLEEALTQLRDLLTHSKQLDEVLHQSGRFEDIRKQIRLGTVPHAEATLTKNQIREGLLDFLRFIAEQSEVPALKKDLEQALISIQNSKNTNTGNLNAGHDLHIGDKTENHFHYGERKILRALTPPPFKNEVFLGRETELEYIRQKLFSQTDKLLLLVNGDGGVGKTSLASRYYHTHAGAYAHEAWLLSEKSIVNALLQLAYPLDVQFDERAGPLERLEVLLPALAELHAPCLLVIDNANEVEDLDASYQYLRRLPNFHLLLTTRVTNFEQAETYHIEGLPYEKALELFQKYYPKFLPGEEDLFRQIREAVAGNTLVIELLAKTLAQANRLKTRYTLADLLQDLQDKGVLQLTQSAPVRTDYQSKGRMRHETPSAIIEAMYDLSELSAAERSLLSNFAVLPAERIGFEMLETLLGSETLEQNLLSLAQKGWIEHNEAAVSFKCSPVVQEIVRQKHAGLWEDCEVLVERLIEKLKYQRGIGHLLNASYEEALALAWFGEAILAVIDIPDYKLFLLADNLGRYYNTTGDLTKALLFAEKSRQFTQGLCLAEPDNPDYKYYLGVSYEKLGDTHSSLGNLDKALAFFEERSRLRKGLYEAYPQNAKFKNGLAISYGQLGETYSSLGNLDKALIFYEDQTTLFEELYGANPQSVSFKNGLSVSYSKLGETHHSLGNLDKSLTFYEKDLELTKALYDEYPQNVSFKNSLTISYEKLGSTHRSLGNLDKALTFFEERSRLGKALYDAFPQNVSFKNGLAISYEKLGSTHRLLGNLDKSLTFYEKDLELTKELYDAYPQNVSFKNGLAISYEKLGDTHRSLGNLDKALDFYEQCNQLARELHGLYPQIVELTSDLSDSYNNLGQLFEQQGFQNKAFEYFEQSIKYRELAYQGSPKNAEFRKKLDLSYRNMGDICEKTGKGELAKRYYEMAEELG